MCDSPSMPRYFVVDRKAYAAIIEPDVPEVDAMTASREASECGYKTRFSLVATVAANEDWESARLWCREIAARFGRETAFGLMRDIKATGAGELEWRR